MVPIEPYWYDGINVHHLAAFNPLIAAITCGMNTVKGGAFLNSGDPKESQHTSRDILAPKMGSPIYGTTAPWHLCIPQPLKHFIIFYHHHFIIFVITMRMRTQLIDKIRLL